MDWAIIILPTFYASACIVVAVCELLEYREVAHKAFQEHGLPTMAARLAGDEEAARQRYDRALRRALIRRGCFYGFVITTLLVATVTAIIGEVKFAAAAMLVAMGLFILVGLLLSQHGSASARRLGGMEVKLPPLHTAS